MALFEHGCCLHPARHKRQDGIALVLVLWLVALLSIMVAGFSYAMRTETWLTIHGIESAQARSLAEAGLWLAVGDLLSPEAERRWSADGTEVETEFDNEKIRLRIQDEAGKIALNEADDELLLGLLKTATATDSKALFLRNAILDWRDADQQARSPGTEDNPSTGYNAKDGPFNSIEELRRVAGMTDKIYGKISKALTIHSLQPGFNPLLAPRSVLDAVPGSNSDLIDEYLANRHIPGVNATITDQDHLYFNADQGRAYTITSTARAGRSRLALTAVIELDRNVTPPYSALTWQESKLHYEHP